MKPLLTYSIAIATLSSTLGTAAFAQPHYTHESEPPASLDQAVPGYQPTIFRSKADVEALFNDDERMPYAFKSPSLFNPAGSQCYMRAQIWTYDFYKNQNIKAMKAFVFYTHTYKELYKKAKKKKFDWWYHVTPYVLAKNAETGALEEWTLDATFSDKILNMKDWSQLFITTNKPCAEYVPYDKFKCEVVGVNNGCEVAIKGTEHCYVVRAPAVDFEPEDVEDRQAGRVRNFNWDDAQTKQAIKEAPVQSWVKIWKKRLGFKSLD